MFVAEQSQMKSDRTLVTHINSIRFNCNQTLKNFKIQLIDNFRKILEVAEENSDDLSDLLPDYCRLYS